MPFDLDGARQAGYSDSEIESHLKSKYPSFRFDDAKKSGYGIDEIVSHLTKKGGENYGKQDQSQTDSDRYAGREADQYGKAGAGEGPQPGEVRMRQPSGGQERFGSVNAREPRSEVPETRLKGGEVTSEEDTKTEGQRAQDGQEDGQGLRGQEDARNQAQVETGGVRPPAGNFFERAGKSIVEKPGASAVAGLGALAETLVELGGGTLAAAVAAPVAVAAGLPTGGIGAGAVEFGAFAAGSKLTEELVVKPVEKLLGIDTTLEEAKAEAPEVAQIAGFASMLPFAAKSALGFAETAGKSAIEELVYKGAKADVYGAAGKAIGKKALGAAAGGAAFEPIRYVAEKGLQQVGIGEEPAPVTAESVLMSAGQMAILGGMGHDAIAAKGLPKTAEVASRLKQPASLDKIDKTRIEAADPHDEVEEAYRLAEDHIKAGNRTEASESLNYAKQIEAQYGVDADTQKNRNARYAYLDSMIEKLPMNEVMNPLPDRRPLPSELAGKKPEEGEKPPTEGVSPAGEEPSLSNLGGLGGGVTDSLYKTLWEKTQAGKTEEAGQPSTILSLASKVRERGGLQSFDDFKNFVQEVSSIPEGSKEERQNALRDIAQKYSKAAEAPAEPASVVGHKVVPRKEGEKFVYDVVQVLRDKAGKETTGEQISTGLSKSRANTSRREADKKAGVAAERPAKYDPFGTEEMPVSNYLLANIGKLEGRSSAEVRAKREGIDLKDTYEAVKRAGRKFFADPTHNKVLGGKVKPDVAAQTLYEKGLIEAPTPDALWDALSRESYESKKRQGEFTKQDRWEKQQIRDYERQQRRESRQQIREGKKKLKELEKKTDERSVAMAQKLREEIAQAEAELKTKKPSEKTAEAEEPKTSGILDVEGEPSVVKTEGEAEGGTAPRVSEGEEKEVKGTKIRSAAYRRPSDGEIFYAQSHIEAMREAGVPEDQIPKERTGREDSRFGFRTDTHDFVTRDEAEAVARKHGGLLDEEGFNASIAENEYHKLHSNDVALADHPEYENPLVTEEKLGPGASKAKELDIESEKKDFIRAASLHQINPELSNNFAKWWSAFKEIASKEDLKRINKFSQEKRHALFEQGRTLLEYSNQFGKGLGLAVEDSKQWWNKTAKQIRNAEAKRNIEPIRLDFDSMNSMLKRMGVEGLEKGDRISQEENYQEAVRRMTNPEDPYYTAKLVESLQDNLRPIDTVEKFVLGLEMIRLDNHVSDLYREANKQKEQIRKDNLTFQARQMEFESQKLHELYRRSVSEGARSLQASQAFLAKDMSFVSMKRAIENILGKEVSESVRVKLQGIADRWKDAGKRLNEASKKAKDNRFQDSVEEIFQAATKEDRERQGRPDRTPEQQVRDFTAKVKGAKGDPLELGRAIRGLFKAIHRRDKTKDAEKLTEATNAIVKKYMGKDWDIEETRKAVGKSGQYYQMTMEAAFQKAKTLPKMVASVFKELESAKKIKDDATRRKRIADVLKKNNIELRDAHSDLKEHITSALSDVQKMMAEMEHQQRECL